MILVHWWWALCEGLQGYRVGVHAALALKGLTPQRGCEVPRYRVTVFTLAEVVEII